MPARLTQACITSVHILGLSSAPRPPPPASRTCASRYAAPSTDITRRRPGTRSCPGSVPRGALADRGAPPSAIRAALLPSRRVAPPSSAPAIRGRRVREAGAGHTQWQGRLEPGRRDDRKSIGMVDIHEVEAGLAVVAG